MDSYNVVHDNKVEAWCVTNEGKKDEPIEIRCFRSKDKAVKYAKWLAQNSTHGRLTVRVSDGSIETMWNYGVDPVG